MDFKLDLATSVSPLRTLTRYTLALAMLWVLLGSASLAWNVSHERHATLESARIQAERSIAKDIVYRSWNAEHGGVYVSVTDDTPPNPDLASTPERDITTPSGKRLTLVNPAYMTRQAHEVERRANGSGNGFGVLAHLSSLLPLRPDNAPDDWERKALESFDAGAQAATSVSENMGGRPYFRLMRPLYAVDACLTCHPNYRVGDVRGGLSVSVPLQPFRAHERSVVWQLTLSHIILVVAGLSLIFTGYLHIKAAFIQIRVLSGLLPICASCKDIRDEKGNWHRIEGYVRDHSNADFSHGVCPKCFAKLYPEYVDDAPRPA